MIRVLAVHNFYQYAGGEDVVFRAEAALLREMGHPVHEFTITNDQINNRQPWSAAARVLWSSETYKKLQIVLRQFKPDVVHLHNFFPLISPSAYYACHQMGVPVVQTLHNYRLMCPAATLYRAGHICEDCLHLPFAWPGIEHACYRSSRAQSAGVAAMSALHRALGTWNNKVSAYIALTAFSRQKFIEGGLPAEKVVIKPNFVEDVLGQKEPDDGYALFVGRLSPEKGLAVILQAWQGMGIPLKIVGDGPLRILVESSQAENPDIKWLGFQTRENVIELMKRATMLVLASEWYENMPVTLLEAFMCGLPVIASRLGGMAEMIEHEKTGLLFAPGDPAELSKNVQRLWADVNLRVQISRAARRTYEMKYTPAANYDQLISIYHQAMGEAKPE
jgi:glycosyltransferase involved in cell wall biosynthesis